ncbi:helix-turn-helix domain-containing protein [Clostridium neuense]|uniref:Helix-turn-helix domain-containing protein n=1 Tax=Clostridium neuense TaxID=1728934 RepID=A0ABW8THY9_9CLOT
MTNVLIKNNKKANSKTIKNNIKNKMHIENISLEELSKKTNISILKLIFLLDFNFSKVKLSYAIKICKALKMKVSDIFI